MLLKIIEVTMLIFAIGLVGPLHGHVVFTSFSARDFQPVQAGWFSLASVPLMLISGTLAYRWCASPVRRGDRSCLV